jgi:phosphomannomutase
MNKQQLIDEIEHQLNEILDINKADIEQWGNNGYTLKKIEAMRKYSKKLFEFARNNRIK